MLFLWWSFLFLIAFPSITIIITLDHATNHPPAVPRRRRHGTSASYTAMPDDVLWGVVWIQPVAMISISNERLPTCCSLDASRMVLENDVTMLMCHTVTIIIIFIFHSYSPSPCAGFIIQCNIIFRASTYSYGDLVSMNISPLRMHSLYKRLTVAPPSPSPTSSASCRLNQSRAMI